MKKTPKKQFTIYLDLEQCMIVQELSNKWDKSLSKTISQMLNDMIEIMRAAGIDEYGNDKSNT
ncbi:MAG: hypothetical protein KQH59_01920 [Desulfobulbaceae bacterium]|nr:hypothetical protein [Desulfobulbaceae bacterium]